MATIASLQALAPACAKRTAGAKSLKAASSSAFTGASVVAAKPVRAATRAAAACGLKVEARFDAGVGVFGNKAGMTQLFTDEGLCVPVTVIAVRDGNVVTQVREMPPIHRENQRETPWSRARVAGGPAFRGVRKGRPT